MKEFDEQMKALILAVRNDRFVGQGTCSVIDECFDDAELADMLVKENCVTEAAAVECARDRHELWLEQALNVREGTDEDPILTIWNEWKKMRGG